MGIVCLLTLWMGSNGCFLVASKLIAAFAVVASVAENELGSNFLLGVSDDEFDEAIEMGEADALPVIALK